MANTRTLKVEIVGDAKGLSKAFGETDTKLSRLSKSIGGTAKTVGLSLAGIGASALAFGPQLLEAGASLEALGKKAETVFSDGSLAKVEKWADGVAASMGLTTKQAVGVAAGVGDLLKPMGFTADQAAAMSTKMLDLSGALSAWSGGQRSATEVAEIMTKAMLGERDGLKELGISISESDVQTRLAAKGQDKLTGSALEQAKALATQELIFEKSADAQKAWADGSMDGVKKQAELKASIERVKEAFITALYPALEGLLPLLQTAATWLGENLPGALKTMGEFFSTVFEGGKQLVADLAETFGTNEGTILKVLGGIALGLTAVAIAWNAGPGLIVTGIVALVAGFLWAYENVEWFRNGVKTAFSAVKTAFDGISSAASWLWATLQLVWDRSEGFRSFMADAFKTGLSWATWAVTSVSTALSVTWGWLQLVWDRSEGLRKFFTDAFKKGIEVASIAIGALVDTFGNIVSAIKDVISYAKTAVEWVGKIKNTAGIGFGIGFPGLGNLGGILGNAYGGDVNAGQVVRVGERGRSELFVPSTPGTIVPHDAMGGGQTIIVQVAGSVVTERQLVDVVHEGLLRKQRSGALGLA